MEQGDASSDDPLGVRASAERLRLLYVQDVLERPAFEASSHAAARSPSPAQWSQFLARLFLVVGSALTLSGAIYFVAFNWDDLGRFPKFGLTGGWVLLGFVIAWLRGATPVGQMGLLAGSVGVGALLAVVGQTYQTGADSWQLFASWAVLILPWVIAGRMMGLWLLWLAVVNAALWFSGEQVRVEWEWWNWVVLAVVNGGAWGCWHWAEGRVAWVRARWVPRVLATVTFLWMLLPSVVSVFDLSDALSDGGLVAIGLLGASAAAALLQAVRSSASDRFPATLAAAAVLVVANTWFGRLLLDTLNLQEFGLLVLSAVILAEAAAFVAWLTRLGPSDEEREVVP